MDGAFYLNVCVLVMFITSQCHACIHSKLSYFEILTPHEITLRSKRDISGKAAHTELSLLVFGRRVSLSLNSGLHDSFLASDATFEAVHANGTRSTIDLDLHNVYQGVIKGHTDSKVISYNHDGLWTILAVHPLPALSFSVEPLNHYTDYKGNDRMVAYRPSDIRMGNDTNEPFCQAPNCQKNASRTRSRFQKHMDYTSTKFDTKSRTFGSKKTRKNRDRILHKTLTSPPYRQSENSRQRQRRDTAKKHLVCDILTLVDYSLFKGMGGGSVHKTAKLIISTFGAVNDIFTSTKFEKSTIGIYLRGMEIYTEPGVLLPIKNQPQKLNGVNLIHILKKRQHYKDFCLVHVTTQIQFQRQTLGLAMTAKKTTFGICGSKKLDNSLNIGISTVVHNGLVISFPVYRNVLAHELGHGFGAQHDNPEYDPEMCYPDESKGGKYLMWYQTTSGLSPNNVKFSPCSIAAMNSILKYRSFCLIPKEVMDHNTCGNGVLDYGEDCDSGKFLAVDQEDECCTDRCRFNGNATCSVFNYPCCKNCQVAPSSQSCTVDNDYSCYEKAFCDGKNAHLCPNPRAKPNGHECANHGTCQNGMCIDYCSILGQRQSPRERLSLCRCDSHPAFMCSICCTKLVDDSGSRNSSPCVKTSKIYDDGTPCTLGYCKNGKCESFGSIDGIDWISSNKQLRRKTYPSKNFDNDDLALILGAFCLMGLCGIGAAFSYYQRRSAGRDLTNGRRNNEA